MAFAFLLAIRLLKIGAFRWISGNLDASQTSSVSASVRLLLWWAPALPEARTYPPWLMKASSCASREPSSWEGPRWWVKASYPTFSIFSALVWDLLCLGVDRLKLRRAKRFLLKTSAVLIFTASMTSVSLAGLVGLSRHFWMFLKPLNVFWDESVMKRAAISNNDSRAVTISQLFAPYFTENLA